MIRIGYIHVVNSDDFYGDPAISVGFPSLAFGYFKSYLERAFGNDVIFERAFPNTISSYDIIGISVLSQDFNIAKRIAKNIIRKNNPKVLVIIGGQHITWLPETMTSDFDIGVQGEGEQTLVELVQYYMNGRREEDLTRIKGIVFWSHGSLVINPPRELIEPLDDIPAPVHEAPNYCVSHVFTSRGCPYKCSFCSSAAFWKKARFNSADFVVNEINTVVKMGFKRIPVMDDHFAASKSRFIEIIEKLKQRGLDKGYNLAIQVTAKSITDEFCNVLKDFRVINEVGFSIESASPRILKYIGKGDTVEENQAAIDRLYSAGISCGTSWIVGWHGETEEELRVTCKFINDNAHAGKLPYMYSFNILMALPGTKVWNDAIEAGLIDVKTFDWDRLRIWAPQLNYPGWKQWKDLRRKYNTLYLNESIIPQERLYDIVSEYAKI
jgi:anaerobic magnesium-protoporphyrin IX monomethyl ester cyclase